ncbi:MAG: hypothetical protein HOQ27_13240 [Dermatophilaceae bacterium]|nr:hypothetical protein [Dermatophilaceae bacterium]NUQ32591.1 hypothetical protein [Dermatophilaceae bacterium]NUR16077.1 hypothetical protein [Dermatophilaceae bacterium]
MSYAIDTEGTRRVGSTLLTAGAGMADCATGFARAGRLASVGCGDAHPALSSTLESFVATHLAALQAASTGFAALGDALDQTASSAQLTEVHAASVIASAARSGP